MANFNPSKIDLESINNGTRYVDGDLVNAESVNAPIEASAYAQEVAEVAEKKATINVRNVTTTTGESTDVAKVTAEISYTEGADNSNLDMTFLIPQGKQGRGFNPCGDWSAGTIYTFDSDKMDTVFYDGNYYVVKITHTSSASITPTNITYWSQMTSKGKGLIWCGAWASGVGYRNSDLFQDLVSYNGKSYIAITTHTSSTSITPTNASYWEIVADSGATFTPSVSSDGTISWTNDKGLANPASNTAIKESLDNVNDTMGDYMSATTERVNELEQEIVSGQGTVVYVDGESVREWNADSKVDANSLAVASGVATLDSSSKLVQRAVYDTNGNQIATYYLTASNPLVSGYLAFTNTNSKIAQASVSPAGNDIGVSGVMITHYNSDEGGLLINEDGAYLWNSTDSGSALKVIDEDVWTNATQKKDADFTTGLLFQIDNSGNVKCKGKFYDSNGESIANNASNIAVTANTAFGSATTLQGVLDYLAGVLTGVNTVTKIKANAFDTD